MAVKLLSNLWGSVRHLVLSQYEKARNLLGLIEKSVNSYQSAENAADRLRNFANLEIASGEWLDLLGKIKNCSRKIGESDDDYWGRLDELLNTHNAGTPNYVIQQSKSLSGDPHPEYLEESPATFLVYTPGGRQMRRSAVRRMAPAGVLGLPAAVIVDARGRRIVDGRQVVLAITDDAGNLLTDEEGHWLYELSSKSRKLLIVARDENIGVTNKP